MVQVNVGDSIKYTVGYLGSSCFKFIGEVLKVNGNGLYVTVKNNKGQVTDIMTTQITEKI
jgi:hypothetical protein